MARRRKTSAKSRDLKKQWIAAARRVPRRDHLLPAPPRVAFLRPLLGVPVRILRPRPRLRPLLQLPIQQRPPISPLPSLLPKLRARPRPPPIPLRRPRHAAWSNLFAILCAPPTRLPPTLFPCAAPLSPSPRRRRKPSRLITPEKNPSVLITPSCSPTWSRFIPACRLRWKTTKTNAIPLTYGSRTPITWPACSPSPRKPCRNQEMCACVVNSAAWEIRSAPCMSPRKNCETRSSWWRKSCNRKFPLNSLDRIVPIQRKQSQLNHAEQQL